MIIIFFIVGFVLLMIYLLMKKKLQLKALIERLFNVLRKNR